MGLFCGVDRGVFDGIVFTNERLLSRARRVNLLGDNIARPSKKDIRDTHPNDGGDEGRNPPFDPERKQHSKRNDERDETQQRVRQPGRKVFHSTQSTLGR